VGPEILGVAEHAMLDQLVVQSGISIESLMENAGRQVANEIAKRWPAQNTFVVCGPGNNGGDGYVVARHLKARGYRVTVLTVGDHSALRDPAKAMAAEWDGPVEVWRNTGTVRPGLYVDAIYGAGLNRAIPEEMAEYWFLVQMADCPIVAVDVPSGLHGDTAAFLGDESWTADLTVTFFRKKPAHVLMPGRMLCGEIVVVDIGIPEGLLHALAEVQHEGAIPDLLFASENVPPLARPDPQPDGHKFDRGSVVVVAVPALATGAARLAARAALRVGAGLVTLAATPQAAQTCAHHVTAEMVRAFEGADGLRALLSDPRTRAVVIGPGLGRGFEERALVLTVLASGIPAVLDADALSAFDGMAGDLFAAIRAVPSRPVILTPHDGEFERLFPGLRKRAVNKIEAARLAAEQSGAMVILKGPDTVIVTQLIAHRPGDPVTMGRTIVNTHAPPWLATAGSGDVLAGMIAGLLAHYRSAPAAAVSAVWLHGAVGEALGPGLIASDLAEALPQVLKNMALGPKFAL
jgi:ADP-dependent NAD(P)H-hydrate dehydratase / NAD(P)H-hydrate epimerase